MKQFHTLTTTLMVFFCAISVNGQISFTDQTSLLQNSANFNSGIAVGISDMNGDGLDDVVRLDKGNMLSIEYQMPNGQPFENYTHGNVSGEAWAMVVGDVNNDGFCDIMAGGFYDQVKVLTAMNSGTSYQSTNLPGATIFVQGSNFADINNDGFLDVFSCHDDGESRIWGNDGTGSFFEADNWIDMATVPASDNSGNYGSTWTDFDNDGDTDLHIAKCRQGVSNPNDPRRINALFVNDGSSNYSEQAAKHGLVVYHQSWTADFQDIDNDGDFDCLLTNHDYSLQLLENDGAGYFTDISEAAGIDGYNADFLQGLMVDFDNDGWVDIITAEPTFLLHNNGNNTFTELNNPLNGNLGTLAVGDLNHDGFVDIYAAYPNGINNPSNIADRMFINDGNDNHFLTVGLRGTQSNTMGVGARIEIHGSWGVQIREVRAGESYGIMNSLSKSFGLGEEDMIEYVVVRWPSGQVDVLSDVMADQFITVVEGSSCALPDFELELDGLNILCPGESATLTAPDGYTYLWVDGSVSQSITTDTPGNFSVVIVDDNGCAAVSNVVNIIAAPDETPSIEIVGDTEFCEGGSVELASSPANGYTWTNGETSESIVVTETGDFAVTIPGACGDFTSEIVHVEVLDAADIPVAEDITIFAPASVTLEATGLNPKWYDMPDAIEPLAEGNSFTTPLLSETTTYYVSDELEYGGGAYATGMEEHMGSLFNGAGFNGQLYFDVYKAFWLRQVTVTTDLPGVRTIELLNSNDNLIASKEIDLPAGQTVVDVDFYIEPGLEYKLGTNTDQNQSTLGTISPRLYRSDENVQYPYEVPGVMSILTANFGSGFYYYFYDWQIELPPTVCASERLPVSVNVEPSAVREVEPFSVQNS